MIEEAGLWETGSVIDLVGWQESHMGLEKPSASNFRSLAVVRRVEMGPEQELYA